MASLAAEVVEAYRSHQLLSHPARLSIALALLAEGKVSFTELQKALRVTPGNLGSHLDKLEKAGLIRKAHAFKPFRFITVYELTEKGLRETLEYTSKLSNALNRALAKTPGGSRANREEAGRQ